MNFASSSEGLSAAQVLRWYLDAGVDEAIGERSVDRYARPTAPALPRPPVTNRSAVAPPPTTATAESAPSTDRATAAQLAGACESLDALKEVLEKYDGCALKRTCQRTVFADGNPAAPVMLIGEAPGADEDRLGKPFVGESGQLLDRILLSIGLDRGCVYIANVVPWRPPGNRKPEPAEVQACLPFITRQIELVNPQLLVFLGGVPATALLKRQDAIGRLRGQWHDFTTPRLNRPIPGLATYHPAYLLRTPAFKRDTWRDFLALRKRLDGLR